MKKEQKLRDFYFALAETIAMIEDCEKLCPTDNLMEMCETLAGIMAEQTEIISAIENVGDEKEWNEIRGKFRRPLTGERFYSSHLDALCDMMRLAKHMKDVSKAKDELIRTLRQLEDFGVLPVLDVRVICSILDAIPRVKTLSSDD